MKQNTFYLFQLQKKPDNYCQREHLTIQKFPSVFSFYPYLGAKPDTIFSKL